MAGNLHAALKSHISGHHAKGLTNNTLYVRLWEGIKETCINAAIHSGQPLRKHSVMFCWRALEASIIRN